MGKIEKLIEKYKNIEKTNGYDPMESAFERGECAGESRVAFEIVEDLQQLKSSLPTQQDKVVVPEFVAKWYVALIKKGWSHVKIVRNSFHEIEMGYVCYTSSVDEWLENEDNQELLIRMKDGYTVEKEPLYYVKLPEKNTDSYNVYGLKKYSDGRINIAVYDRADIGKSMNSKLTEKEIKSVDEKYWAFAVPVEEEAE